MYVYMCVCVFSLFLSSFCNFRYKKGEKREGEDLLATATTTTTITKTAVSSDELADRE